MRVAEVFFSIQGESTWAGRPCVFVRLAGCELRCTYCDTPYARDGGEAMSVGAIVERCLQWPCRLVEITGGEPLLQEACPALARALLEAGFTVLVETSGALPVHILPPEAIRIMDLKCPGSGMADRNDWTNVDALTGRDEVKFVIGDRGDYEWSKDAVERLGLTKRCHAVLFSAAGGAGDGGLAPRDLAQWILADGLDVRFQLQLHKYVWPPDERGV